MYNYNLNGRIAVQVQRHLERLLEIDEEFCILWPSECLYLSNLLKDVKVYRKTFSKKKRLCHANNPITTSSIR